MLAILRMTIEDFYFIGRNQTEIFRISLVRKGEYCGKKFGNFNIKTVKDNIFQKDADL